MQPIVLILRDHDACAHEYRKRERREEPDQNIKAGKEDEGRVHPPAIH